MTSKRHFCRICQAEKLVGQTWFLMVQSQWDDRIKILAWNDELAKQAGVLCACSSAHVKELVAHWMATGNLNYPFAWTNVERRRLRAQPCSTARPSTRPDVEGVVQLSELSVHRETLRRILEENPYSLASILEALVSGLDRGPGPRAADAVDTSMQESELQACLQ